MMLKIMVGGQMDKQVIANLIEANSEGKIEVLIKSDLEAALGVQSGQADYYIGACATGAGAAIAMAIGMLGADACVSLSIPGKVMTSEEIKQEVDKGKKAFGFVNTDAERMIPILITYLLER